MVKKYKSKLDKEKKKKRELEEDLEYLRQVDVPDDQGGGRKFIADYEEEQIDAEKIRQDTVKTYIEGQGHFTYKRNLAEYGFSKLTDLGLDDGWEYYCVPTEDGEIKLFDRKFRSQNGILVIIKSPKGNVYVRGMKVTRDPEFDINAINVLVMQAENTVDSEKGLLLSDNKDTESTFKKTKSGIYAPN